MPQDEEASTQNSMDDVGGGLVRVEPQKTSESRERHQAMSDKAPVLGVF
jgi:hypothetical protein